MIEKEWPPKKPGETMRLKMAFQISVVVSLLIVANTAVAQQRGTPAPAAMPAVTRPMFSAAPAPIVHSVVHSAAPSPVSRNLVHPPASGIHSAPPRAPIHPVAPTPPVHKHPIHWNPIHTNGPAGVGQPGAGFNCGVPGLGFDYEHYAAVHPNGQPGCFQGGSVFPFEGGGIFIPTAGYGYVDGESGAEPAADAQQNESPETTAEAVEPAPEEQVPTAPRLRSNSSPAPTPIPEFIFVRRDGTVFFAVAYSWVDGNLQYITRDGLRKLVSATTLDFDATRQFNEQRGVTFRSPA